MTTISAHEVKALVEWLGGELKDGSIEDLEGRRALARVLRHGPVDRGLLFVLADLIDPDQREDIGLWLTFKRPPGRKKTTDWRRVAAVIWRELRRGKQQKTAVSIAMEECGVGSRDKALAAYKKWKPIFERDGSKLKALTRTD
jgi:hypothetical protein